VHRRAGPREQIQLTVAVREHHADRRRIEEFEAAL
jgi:hypothetical protein